VSSRVGNALQLGISLHVSRTASVHVRILSSLDSRHLVTIRLFWILSEALLSAFCTLHCKDFNSHFKSAYIRNKFGPLLIVLALWSNNTENDNC